MVKFYFILSRLFSFVALSVTALFTLFYFLDEDGSLWSIIIGFLISVLPWFGTYHELSYNNDYLIVETVFKARKYDLRKVKSINGCYGAADWTFEIEFYPEKGSSLKIEYLPSRNERMYFLIHDAFIGRSKAFEDKIRELHLNS